MRIARTASLVAYSVTTLLLAASSGRAGPDDLVFGATGHGAPPDAFGLPAKLTDVLQVNRSRSFRLLAPEKCQEQGELELRALAETATVEEAYAFIPSLCLWMEVGQEATGKTVRLDTEAVDGLLRRYPSIALYHIHPGQPSDVAGYFPAYADLIGLVLINARFLDDPSVSIGHRSVTARGLIDYAFVVTEETDRLLDKMRRTGLGAFVSQNLAYEYARSEHELRYYDAVRTCARLSEGAPERLAACFPMRADDFVLNYRELGE